MDWSEQFEIIKDKFKKILSDEGGSYSRAKLEKLLGAGRGKVQAWDKGQRPSVEDLAAISRALHLSPRWLLLGEGEPEEARGTAPEKEPRTLDALAPAEVLRIVRDGVRQATGTDHQVRGEVRWSDGVMHLDVDVVPEQHVFRESAARERANRELREDDGYTLQEPQGTRDDSAH